VKQEALAPWRMLAPVVLAGALLPLQWKSALLVTSICGGAVQCMQKQ
jgi:hypothetical protein